MNAWYNILKFIFLKCHTLVLEKGLLFQHLTRVMQFVVKHVSFLDRKPFHCQIHMGRKFCFPGCRDSRQVSTTRTQSIERALSVEWSGGYSTFQTINSGWNPQQNTCKTCSPEFCMYLVDQPGTMKRTWFHAHMQKQNCVTLPAVISHLSSPGPTPNMSPVIWRFWVSHNYHGVIDSENSLRDFQRSSSPGVLQRAFNYIRFLRIPSKVTLNVPRYVTSVTSLGNMFHFALLQTLLSILRCFRSSSQMWKKRKKRNIK